MRHAIRVTVAVSAIFIAFVLMLSSLSAQSITKLKSGTKAITAAATQINTASGCSVLVGNLSTTKVWIGGSDVTTSGWPICSDTSACFSTAVEIPGSLNAAFAITTDGGSVTWLQGSSCK